MIFGKTTGWGALLAGIVPLKLNNLILEDVPILREGIALYD